MRRRSNVERSPSIDGRAQEVAAVECGNRLGLIFLRVTHGGNIYRHGSRVKSPWHEEGLIDVYQGSIMKLRCIYPYLMEKLGDNGDGTVC